MSTHLSSMVGEREKEGGREGRREEDEGEKKKFICGCVQVSGIQ